MDVSILSRLGEISSPQFVIAFTALVCLFLAYTTLVSRSFISPSKFWESQHWVGRRDQYWSHMRAAVRSLRNSQSMVAEGYAMFSKLNRPFMFPNMSSGPILLIPPSQVKSIIGKLDDEVDGLATQADRIQSQYTVKDKEVWENNFHFNVIRTRLTRNLARLTPAIEEELALGFEQYWGTSKEWSSAKLSESCFKIIARAANRVFCRNEEFLEHCRQYATAVFGGATLISMFPAITRPIVGRLVGLAGNKHLSKCQELATPIIKKRLWNIAQKREKSDFEWEVPDDGLQWVIDECLKRQSLGDLDPARVAHRLLMINLVAIHSTGVTTTNTLLDLFSSKPSDGFVDGLREESERVLAEANGVWTKAAVANLIRVDSTIKESMRFSDIKLTSLPRLISAANGIELDGNIHIPKGILIGVPSHAIHHDDTYYPAAERYDAFRFSRPYEEHLAKKGTEACTADTTTADGDTKSTFQPVVNVGETFLSFGYSRHACPGRFFASLEMKLMLAYIVQHYEVEFWAERPAPKVIADAQLPPSSAEIRFRRRVKV